MKLHAIIGKKQIVLASLVLILGIAVYLNWQFANSDQSLTVTDVLNGNTSQTNYGEAELVDAKTSDSNYFDWGCANSITCEQAMSMEEDGNESLYDRTVYMDFDSLLLYLL